MTTSSDIADQAENLKTSFVGLQLSFVFLLHPDVPLLRLYQELFNFSPDTPVEVHRHDGSAHSDESIGEILRRLTTLPGGGFEEGLLPLAAIYGATQIGDDLAQADLITTEEPLLQFARHLRNACAHGNRWHFRRGEPRHPAALRGRQLDASLHGSKAVYGWLEPGDYLDFLDDLASLLRR